MNIAWPAANIRWEWLPAGSTSVDGQPPPVVGAWLETGSATAVKSGEHRVVYRVDLPKGPVYLKHYRCQRMGDVLRQMVRASASRRESQRALELTRRGIASVAPLAVGEVRRGPWLADHFLVTAGIADSCPLDEYIALRLAQLPPGEGAARRRTLLDSLARFCARLHEAGAEHNDLHLGNLIVRLDQNGAARCTAAGDIELHLIDVPGVRFSGPLNWRRSRRNLAMFCASAATVASTADLRRFLLAYLQARPRLNLTNRSRAAHEMEQSIVVCMRDKQRSRDRRVWGNNRDYYRLTSNRGNACAVAQMPHNGLADLLASAKQLVARWQQQPVKLGHRGVVLQGETTLGDKAVPVAVKRSREPAWKRWLSGRFHSRAARQWHAAHALLARGIATPQPLACLEPPGNGRWSESFLMTRWLPGAVDLHHRAWSLAALSPLERRRAADRAAQTIGHLLGRMHAWRISHRDLKWCNVLIESNDAPQAFLVDLDGLRLPRRWRLAGPIAYRTRVRNLARLAVGRTLHPWLSRTTCWRFVRAYASHHAELSRADVKRLARDVSAAAERYAATARREQRPLG